MKTTIRIAALLLVLTMTVFMFAACGKKLSGEYTDALTGTTTYEFSGKNFTCTMPSFVGSTVVKGTYAIDEDEITFTSEDGKEQTVAFSEGEENGVKFIKIAGIKYNKK